MKVVYAMAPPSVGNMAVGFDILGHALDAPGDQVRATRRTARGVVMGEISGVVTSLPVDAEKNTAGFGVMRLLEEQGADFGVELAVHKQIALGSGMGGSAASAVAAVVAANQLLDKPLQPAALLPYALAGESVASGAVHGDNVAPSLFGGIVFIPPHRPAAYVQVPVPLGLQCVLIRPHIRLDTLAGRTILQPAYALDQVVYQSANLASVLCACFTNDVHGLGHALQDVLIEPQRSHQIKGFAEVKAAAIEAGALGFTISGSGPSMIAWCEPGTSAPVRTAMETAIQPFFTDYELLQSGVDAKGAALIGLHEWRR